MLRFTCVKTGVTMRVISFTEARNGLNQVEEDADFTVIHRRDRGDAVVMGLD